MTKWAFPDNLLVPATLVSLGCFVSRWLGAGTVATDPAEFYGLIIDPRPMFTRKKQLRLRRTLVISTIALVANLIVPAMAHGQEVDSSVDVGNSNAVIVQPTLNETPAPSTVPLSTLPTATDKPVTVLKQLNVHASAYSSTVDQCDGDPFTTASGQKVRDGIIAVNGLPFGTKVRIPSHFGDKVFVVSDRMSTKWGTLKKIDIWMPTRAAAIQWGVRTVTIEIIS